MLLVGAFCIALVVLTTVIHYEVLRTLTMALPGLQVPARAKLIVVIVVTFCAHATEMLLYAVAFYVLARYLGAGTLDDATRASLAKFLYFSAETFTTLGYGDVVPGGSLRFLAGMEALNGLLLIGWSASYAYIAMERFWGNDGKGVPAMLEAQAESAAGAIDPRGSTLPAFRAKAAARRAPHPPRASAAS